MFTSLTLSKFRLSLTDIVFLLSSAGASSTPTQPVRSPERPDLMLSEPPPWSPDYNQDKTENHPAVPSSQPEKSDEKFSAGIFLQKLKLNFTKIFPHRQSKKFSRPTELSNIMSAPKGAKYLNSKLISIERSFYKLLKNKKSKEKKNDKKFSKIWLENPDGKTMKLYTFRKED